MKKRLVSMLMILFGAAIVMAAIFASQLGLEQVVGWGRGRILVLAIGLFISALFFLDFKWLHSRFVELLFFARPIRTYVMTGICVLFVIAVYIWFVSIGQWTSWPRTTIYYDQLATAFQNGQLNLQIKVDPQLLALSDPYDPNQRSSVRRVDYIWDMSLYKGKVYLYWGPVPAFVLIPLQIISSTKVGDDVLSFIFSAGLILFQSLLMLKIWKHFFSSVPEWTVALGILVAGLTIPILYVLSYASVYEAAITGAQFFFMGGLYFAVLAIDDQKLSLWKLTLAGILWSCAVNSRAFLLLPVIFMAVMVSLWIVRNLFRARDIGKTLQRLLALGIPLALGAIAFGWYNWARFDSPLETGLRYQITNNDLNQLYSQVFQPSYILPNLQAYLFRTFGLSRGFPFMTILEQASQMRSMFGWPIPPLYIAYGGIGMIAGAPFVLFALIAVTTFIRDIFKKNSGQTDDQDQYQFRWLFVSLFGSFLLPFGGLLLLLNSAMKYMLDFMPCLILLAMIGLWQGYQLLEKKKRFRRLYATLVVGAGVYSFVTSALLALSINAHRFLDKNPTLFNSLVNWFAKFIK